MRKTLAPLLLLALSMPLLAQSPTSTQREEMKKLGFLQGEWEGEGWIITPDGKRFEYIQTERIQYKLGGAALLIEGMGKDKSTNAVAFEAIAVVFYDDKAKLYRMHSGTTEGRSGDAEMRLIEGGVQWGLEFPGGRVSYTIKLTQRGEWFEVGEFSQEGSTWRKFHEMTLKKVK
jgi:hypothetical protein